MQAVPDVKTSERDPLRIASLIPGDDLGQICITSCPGDKDPYGRIGNWYRNLDLDLDEGQRRGRLRSSV